MIALPALSLLAWRYRIRQPPDLDDVGFPLPIGFLKNTASRRAPCRNFLLDRHADYGSCLRARRMEAPRPLGKASRNR